jgi:Uma2 family endonuclease
MAQPVNDRLYSVEEYLSLENLNLEKHEYYRGQIYQMSGGSPEHSLIISNVNFALKTGLKGKSCRVFSSEVLIRVQHQNHYSYADTSVVCSRPEYEQIGNNRMLTNPQLLVEVLSPSTENYDRGTKFQLYKNIPTFRDYLLVDSRKIYVQHYQKIDSNTWQEKTYKDPDNVITIENLGFEITVSELYEGVEFEPEITII